MERKEKKKKRKEKTTPFGVNLMRSQVLYRAAQSSNKNITAILAKQPNSRPNISASMAHLVIKLPPSLSHGSNLVLSPQQALICQPLLPPGCSL